MIKAQNYVNGEWVGASSGKIFESIDPATQEIVGFAPNSSAKDTEQAIDAARKAFDSGPWPHFGGEERAKILLQLGDLLRSNVECLARLITLENGRPLKSTRAEVIRCARIAEYYAAEARTLTGQTNLTVPNAASIVSYEPVGVCGLIVPWNFPLDLTIRKMAPALAVGCTIVLKPSSLTPIATFEFIRLLPKIKSLPKGVVNLIIGSGRHVGETLVRSHNVDKISFTGETKTGKTILQVAADTMKRVSLECGGKSPNIVFGDAPLEAAIEGALWGTFHNTGQSCTAKSRLLVEASIHDLVVSELVELVRGIRIGPGIDEETDIGPLASQSQLDKVLHYIDAGIQEGARLIVGGKQMTGKKFDRGFFIEPTIFDHVEPSMDLAQHEIFGPVLSILTFSNEEEAIQLANSTSFGLSSAIWTMDVKRIFRVSKQLRVGEVMVNNVGVRLPEAPFGGFRQSGMGRELGSDGLREYLEAKHMYIDLG